MPCGFGELVVVALAGLDVAEARPAPHHIYNDDGHFGGGNVAEPLLHEADAGTAGAGHHPRPRGGRAINHVDGGDFAFGLEEDTAEFDHSAGHVFQQFGLGGDGVAKIRLTARPHGRFGQGHVSFKQLLGHDAPP